MDWIYPFHAISSNLTSAGRKLPIPRNREFLFRLDLSISCNFEQLCFCWQNPPLQNREISLDWIYPFLAILSNFASAGNPPPPTSNRKNFFRLDLYISCNFEQLCFTCQKSPSQKKNFFRLDLSISCNFKQLDFSWHKSPITRNREIFFRLDLSISCNFKQFAPAGRKPLPNRQTCFKTGSIHFMISCNFKQFCFSCKKSPLTPSTPMSPKQGKFLDWICPFHANFEQLWFSWQ